MSAVPQFKRFSRQQVLVTIEAWMAELEGQYGIFRGNGRSVVRDSTDDKKIDFGRYECLCDLLEEFSE